MQAADVKWLQVENTTKCNAWCTSCGRNNGGYGLRDDFVDHDLSIERFTEVLDQLTNLHGIQFCGTYGDSCASTLSMQHFELACARADQVNIHTNGSLRSTVWWAEVANLLTTNVEKHEVWFTLDGLAGTHEIYRQGTNWQKTIDNATAFINAGGHAVWQFIPFAHNEHEIMQCIKLSQQLGFKTFKFVRDVRYPYQSRHYQTGEIISILPWSKDQQMSKYEQPNRTVTESECRHLQQPSVYLNASGKISHCCFFNKHRAVDSIVQLPDMPSELASNPNQQCLLSCGTCATIDTYDDN
jgi:hypothetical protein